MLFSFSFFSFLCSLLGLMLHLLFSAIVVLLLTSLIMLFLIVCYFCMIIRGHKREGGW